MTITAESVNGLKERLGERLILDDATRQEFQSDFGRMIMRLPCAVARCENVEEIAEVVKYCRENGIPIAPRGPGHTQSGQSTTEGVVIDTSSMQNIYEINDDHAYCDGGVIWKDLVKAALDKGLIPPVLTNNLNVSIAGTTSVAGLGVHSFRYGAQSDNAVWLEVVTGTGEIVHCSADENKDLFDCARSGLGQFGIITKIKTRLHKAKSMIRNYFLMYDDLGQFMKDSEIIMAKGDMKYHSMESRCAPCAAGFKSIGEGMGLGIGRQAFAYWLYPMSLTVDFEPGNEPDDKEILGPLNPYRMLHQQDVSHWEFTLRLEPLFELWHRSGYWDGIHPWMETILPWGEAQGYIEEVLSQLPPQALGPGGHILLWPSRGDTSEVPLFKYPDGEFVMGWGLLPGIPAKYQEEACMKLDMASELSIWKGAKRYLSGFITFDTEEKWANHFGDVWLWMKEMKKKWDPDGIFAPGFIQYE